MLIFVVALQSPESSSNWSHVSRLCIRALRSMCAQRDGEFRVILVCNHSPEGIFTHPNLEVIEEEFPIPTRDSKSRMNDKWAKIKRGLIAARRFAPAHVMVADADDCVHYDLAALVKSSPNAQGWSFEKGYLYDEGTNWLYTWDNFNRYCGTSAIVRLEPDEFPKSMDDSVDHCALLCHGHQIIADHLRQRGTPLEPLPFLGAVYIVATGENDSGFGLKGWRGWKMFLKKLRLMKPLTKRRRREFNLSAL